MQIKIGEHMIGPGNPTFIVAEMSGNHGGSLEQAVEIIRAAKRAGADAVKLQTYTADTITLKNNSPDFTVPPKSPWASHTSLWDLYDKAHTPWEWHPELFRVGRSLGLEVFSSPFDISAVDFLESLGAPAYKIASPEITDVNLLQKVAETGKPIIVSTGIADLQDIETALWVLRQSGAKEIILLKCTTSYPAPVEDSCLQTMTDYQRRFGVISGLSDHTIGSIIAIASVVLGASFLEKHFKLDNDEETVDSFFSAGEIDFSKMVNNIRLVEKALGSVSYQIAESAMSNYNGRRSLYISAPIKAGEMFSEENVRSVRPALGLHPMHFDWIKGRRARIDLKAGDRLTWDVVI